MKRGAAYWIHQAILSGPAKATAPVSWWIGLTRERLQETARQEVNRMQRSKFARPTLSCVADEGLWKRHTL